MASLVRSTLNIPQWFPPSCVFIVDKMYSLKSIRRKVFVLRKNVIIFICFLVFSGLTINYMKAQNVTLVEPFIMHLGKVGNNISCHYIDENDALPAAEDSDFIPQPNSIFFHETSCKGGLNSRQACAVESAARAHPTRNIYVMFSGPVSSAVYERSCIMKLRNFHNIGFARVHITEYAKNTPLEAIVADGRIDKSQWRVEHTSDAMRFLTLYKWGGVYLDTDMVVVKPLTPLGDNWVGRESNKHVAVGGLAISMDHVGRKFAEAVINEFKTTFRPDIWRHNGPGTMTRVLQRMCNTPNITEWSTTTCQGFEVYSQEYLYPIHYKIDQKYFKTGELKNVDNAYTHHLWNKLTHDMKIEKDSPYEKMAREFCPTIYDMYGEEFGS